MDLNADYEVTNHDQPIEWSRLTTRLADGQYIMWQNKTWNECIHSLNL